MIQRQLSTKETKALQAHEELCKLIRNTTAPLVDMNESEEAKKKRIQNLIKKGNEEAFCEYYFPHYMTNKQGVITKLAWFHKKALKTMLPDTLTVLEWAREHAKSVLAIVFFPILLYSRDELNGMVVSSSTEKKANKLLGDVKAELTNNKLWINDFGEKKTHGNWADGEFVTSDGIGFWAFGLGQSPRGIREAMRRPNYCAIDDGDTKERCRNIERLNEAVDWIKEDLFGCFGIMDGSIFVVAGNRISNNSIIAKIVGDVEEGDPINQDINHIKVFALENPKTHEMDLDGVPAWDRFSIKDFEKRWKLCGPKAKLREYFHIHVEEGTIFKDDWITWGKVPLLSQLLGIEVYGDPSFKNNKTSDFKAIITQGKGIDGKIYVLEAWVRQESMLDMVKEYYRLEEKYGANATYRMEANFVQDLLLDEFENYGNKQAKHIAIRGDKRAKENKQVRIEAMSGLYQGKKIIYNEKLRKDKDMQRLKDQLLKFPYGKDDAPDAQEGGLHYLQKITRHSNFKPRLGNFTKSSNRM